MGVVRIDDSGEIRFRTLDYEIRRQVEEGSRDLGVFCEVFMPHTFSEVFTNQHRELIRYLDDDRIARLAVCAWRGFGKTSIFSAFVVRNILYRKSRFVLYVSSNHENAMNITEGIKYELCNNDKILEVFGSVKPMYDTNEIKLGFSKKAYYVHDPESGEPIAYVTPKGAGQACRGLNVILGNRGRVRPDLICVDDIETDEDVLSEELRGRIRVWFMSALLNTVNTKRIPKGNMWDGESHYRIIVLDTMKHKDSLIRNLRDNSLFKYISYPRGRYEGGKWYSNVPEWITDDEIRREVEEAERYGNFSIYRREMLCDERSMDIEQLDIGDICYYEGDDVVRGLDCFITVDPARTLTGSSKTAITVTYVDFNEYRIYIHEQIVSKMSIEEQMLTILELCRRYRPQFFAIETVGADDYLKAIIETEILSEVNDVVPVYLRPTRMNAKEVRALDLIRLYKAGRVLHNARIRDGELEQQLLSFPNNRHYDAIDSAGFIIDTIIKINAHFPSINSNIPLDNDNSDIIQSELLTLKPMKVSIKL